MEPVEDFQSAFHTLCQDLRDNAISSTQLHRLLEMLQKAGYIAGDEVNNLMLSQSEICERVLDALSEYRAENKQKSFSEESSTEDSNSDMKSSWVASLPYDVFVKFVLDNNIKGKDLIALCGANSEIRDKCNHKNQEMWRKLLARDHGITKSDNPRADYVRLFKLKVWGCGNTRWGQLGFEYIWNEPVSIPTLMPAPKEVVQVACGFSHNVFVTTEGQAWSLGDNYNGQLGLGVDNKEIGVPTLITTLKNVAQVACGSHYTVFLTTTGHVWSCGQNDVGQLGLGDNVDRNLPVLNPTLKEISQVACGAGHTFFVTREGKVWSCGYNDDGQLGLGIYDKTVNVPTQLPRVKNIVQVACGGSHTIFIVKGGKDFPDMILGCGSNMFGELGIDIARKSAKIPTLIPIHAEVAQVACGDAHTVFVTTVGQVWGCGSNKFGKLGLGVDIQIVTTPTLIPIPKEVVKVTCGRSHTVFLTTTGHVWSCGQNDVGQLGLGVDDKTVSIPTIIPTLQKVVDVDCGGDHSIFLVE